MKDMQMMGKMIIPAIDIDKIKRKIPLWKMTDWERSFVSNIVAGGIINDGLSEIQYKILNDIAGRNSTEISASTKGTLAEYEMYEELINDLKKIINRDNPPKMGHSYDFGKHAHLWNNVK